jgi:hypothetical protein
VWAALALLGAVAIMVATMGGRSSMALALPRADVPIGSPRASLPQAGVGIVEDPVHPRHVVAAINDYNAPQGTSVYVSDDAGHTWHAVPAPRMPQQKMGDPRLAYGPHGLLYLAVTGYDVDRATPQQTVHLSINLFQSRDGGHHWRWLGRPSGPPPRPPLGDDYPSLAVDPASGAITIAWTAIQGEHEFIAVARSTDGGRSFTPRLLLPTHLGEGAVVVLNRAGAAIVAFMDLQHNAISVSEVRQRVLWTSHVGPLQEIPSNLPGLRFRVESYPALAIDRQTGRLYLAWPVLVQGHTQMAFATSADGRHWSRMMSLRGLATADLFMPSLAVSPTGVVALSAYGRLGGIYRIYLVLSTSCGRHFSSPAVLDSVPSPLSQGGPIYLGDFAGLAIDSHVVHSAWTDTRAGVPMIYTSAVPIPAMARC